MKRLKFNTLLISLIASLSLAIYIFTIESEKRNLKADIIELSKVKYGIFSVDEWKKVLAEIVSKKVDELDLANTNQAEMRRRISNFLITALDKIEGIETQKNKKKIFGGLVSNIGTSLCLDKFRENIPQVTNDIMNFINKPENREEVKRFITQKIDDYADKTFAEIDYTYHDEILARHGSDTRQSAVMSIKEKIQIISTKNQLFYYILYGLIGFQGILLLISGKIKRDEFLLYVFTSVIVLFLGLLLPMIDIDARISKMTFNLLGEPVAFTDQVLYFKSKSILEVVQLMLLQGKYDLMAVGVLVLVFSVMFPLTKLFCSLLYIQSRKIKKNAFIKFMVFKTGKWSMADVMVVAIFMAYIGFTGIITEQLLQLERIANTIDILTTNHSSLQLGFFMFASFVVLSLFLSQKITTVN